ncbi:MAG: YggS family pyridoxal phosphate-dependent enzyme [Clostridia bacterium]|nr:YggS family pyridoxal phosphate-dependent enzyme [Clostridia bacterium]
MADAFDYERMAENVAFIRQQMADAARAAGRKPEEILLCAACKTRTPETVSQSAQLPIDLFGENHMQELVTNFDAGAYLGKPVHFIGHLQTNKVKKVVGRASCIQSIDSLHLMEAVEKEAARQNLRQDILLEVNIGEETTKTGADADALWQLLDEAEKLEHLRVRGLMAIPPAFDNGDESRRYFAMMRKLLEEAKDRGYEKALLDTLSMGMSDSFLAAIAEGATVVRVGTAIYGARYYPPKTE